MSNILEHINASRSMADIKSALREIGADVNEIDDLNDVAATIRQQCSAGVNTVVNASLASGPGIKITPIDRKGYKISATDQAVTTQDLSDRLPAGTSVGKVLWTIVNRMIPGAIKTAIETPQIVDMDTFKAEYDGIDYYQNRAFGQEGAGRKSGLRAGSWYIRLFTTAQREPLYLDLGPVLTDIRKEIFDELKRDIFYMVEKEVRRQVDDVNGRPDCDCGRPYHRPGKPGRPVHKPVPPVSDDPYCDICVPEKPKHPHHPHHPGKPGCGCERPDFGFGGYDDDDPFNVDPGTSEGENYDEQFEKIAEVINNGIEDIDPENKIIGEDPELDEINKILG